MTITRMGDNHVPQLPPETATARHLIELHCSDGLPDRGELEVLLRLAYLRGYVAGIEASQQIVREEKNNV